MGGEDDVPLNWLRQKKDEFCVCLRPLRDIGRDTRPSWPIDFVTACVAAMWSYTPMEVHNRVHPYVVPRPPLQCHSTHKCELSFRLWHLTEHMWPPEALWLYLCWDELFTECTVHLQKFVIKWVGGVVQDGAPSCPSSSSSVTASRLCSSSHATELASKISVEATSPAHYSQEQWPVGHCFSSLLHELKISPFSPGERPVMDFPEEGRAFWLGHILFFCWFVAWMGPPPLPGW